MIAHAEQMKYIDMDDIAGDICKSLKKHDIHGECTLFWEKDVFTMRWKPLRNCETELICVFSVPLGGVVRYDVFIRLIHEWIRAMEENESDPTSQ